MSVVGTQALAWVRFRSSWAVLAAVGADLAHPAQLGEEVGHPFERVAGSVALGHPILL